ncbi:hypothetical protein [Parelusimicrobium proximum]|uniref:hypothetical protein n=1 Tax=Parelusimicrobium proximum TaxID=3228953 RepID=UPI003D172B60
MNIRKIMTGLLICLSMSLMSGCASYGVKSSAVCFPAFDLTDEKVYELNKHNRAKIYAIECLCVKDKKCE